MSHRVEQLKRRRSSGFTLIEIMVTIGIILVLAVMLLAVGKNVQKKSQEGSTRTMLKTLEGIVDDWQTRMGTTLPTTLYDTNGQGAITLHSGGPSVNYVDLLCRDPKTKDQLGVLLGNKLKITTAPAAILDPFGNPIHFIQQGATPGSWPSSTAQPRDYLRSSGPDGVTNWNNQSDTQNNDDILSYEAGR